jgi:hypothetical protein
MVELGASVYRSSPANPIGQNFAWQVIPTGNDTATPSSNLALLYGEGTLDATGFSISPKGIINFASGQTFPGAGGGTITGVTAGTGLTGGGTTGNVALSVDPTQVPLLAANNTFTGSQTVLGNLSVTAPNPGDHAGMGNFSSQGASDSNSVTVSNGTATTETFQAGCDGCFVPGAQPGDGGIRVTTGSNIIFGDAGTSRLKLDSSGNAFQPPTANGMAKAMFLYSPYNGGGFDVCFNSTLSGAAATTPPCGFSIIADYTGDYILDLGFEIDNRFLSATGASVPGTTVPYLSFATQACTDISGNCNNPTLLTPNRMEVTTVHTLCSEGYCQVSYTDIKVYVIVY